MTKEIPLSKGKVAHVSDEDYDYLIQWSWYYTRNGYAMTFIDKHSVLMHRLITGASRDEIVHHVDEDKLNNERVNLLVMPASDHARGHVRERHGTPYPTAISTAKGLDLIRELRGSLTVREFAKKVGVGNGAVKKWERWPGSPSPESCILLIRAYPDRKEDIMALMDRLSLPTFYRRLGIRLSERQEYELIAGELSIPLP